MLEAIISLRRGRTDDKTIGARDTAIKKAGDIVAVKKKPAIWSEPETNGVDFEIRQLRDDALEGSMKKGNMIYPYAVYVEKQVGTRTMRRMVNRSKYRMNTVALDGIGGLEKPEIIPDDMIFDDTERK